MASQIDREIEETRGLCPRNLQEFIDDFAGWPQEEKEKLIIKGLSYLISNNINAEIKKKYGGNIGFWIDCRTPTLRVRDPFMRCLSLLQTKGTLVVVQKEEA